MKENEEISEGLSIKDGGGLLTLPVVKGFIEFALYKTEKTTHIKSFYVACFVDLKRIAFCTQQTSGMMLMCWVWSWGKAIILV